MLTPKDHDFDWVSATEECSLAYHFAKLEATAKYAGDTRQEAHKRRHSESRTIYRFQIEQEGKIFLVCRDDECSGTGVRFTMKDDHILAEETRERTQSKITLTLNEDGECRYQIDGKEKEYLRWQVLRKTLKDLLFARANR